MQKTQNKKLQYILVLSGIFLVLFIFSLLFFLIEKGDRTRIVLFFPDTSTGKLAGEERYIKKRKNHKDNIHELISEILLGPALPGSSPIFPGDTEILSVFLKKKHLLINFSKEVIFPEMKNPIGFYKGLRACINSVKFNFPWIRNISFFVHGEPVPMPQGDDSEQDNENPEIKFTTDLLK